YFQMAATAPGALGQQAQAAFLQLDVADNPATCIQSGVVIDRSGRLILQVANRAPMAIASATFELQGIVNGQPTRQPFTVNNVPAGQVSEYDTGVRFPAGTTAQMIQAQSVLRAARVQ